MTSSYTSSHVRKIIVVALVTGCCCLCSCCRSDNEDDLVLSSRQSKQHLTPLRMNWEQVSRIWDSATEPTNDMSTFPIFMRSLSRCWRSIELSTIVIRTRSGLHSRPAVLVKLRLAVDCRTATSDPRNVDEGHILGDSCSVPEARAVHKAFEKDFNDHDYGLILDECT